MLAYKSLHTREYFGKAAIAGTKEKLISHRFSSWPNMSATCHNFIILAFRCSQMKHGALACLWKRGEHIKNDFSSWWRTTYVEIRVVFAIWNCKHWPFLRFPIFRNGVKHWKETMELVPEVPKIVISHRQLHHIWKWNADAFLDTMHCFQKHLHFILLSWPNIFSRVLVFGSEKLNLRCTWVILIRAWLR